MQVLVCRLLAALPAEGYNNNVTVADNNTIMEAFRNELSRLSISSMQARQSLAQYRATRQLAAIIKKPLDDEEASILPAICLSTQCLICFGNKHMDIDSRLKMFFDHP